jgi:hypothetical protein
LIYWYTSTNTDAAAGGAGTQFACFTGTKVQILTLQRVAQYKHADVVAMVISTSVC